MRYLLALLVSAILLTSAGSPYTVTGQLRVYGDGFYPTAQFGNTFLSGVAAYSDGSTNWHIFQYPSISSNLTWIWPASYGSSGYVLTSDGLGGLTFSAPSGGAPADATYITQTSNVSLTNEQALSSLSSGYMKSTTGTGVVATVTTIPHTDVSGGTSTEIAYFDSSGLLSHSSDWFFNFTSTNAFTGLKNGSTSGGRERIYEDSDNGTNYTGWEAPSSLAANWLNIFPSTLTSGFWAQDSATRIITQRTITAGSGISVTDGDGVSGNPTINSVWSKTGTTLFPTTANDRVIIDVTAGTLPALKGTSSVGIGVYGESTLSNTAGVYGAGEIGVIGNGSVYGGFFTNPTGSYSAWFDTPTYQKGQYLHRTATSSGDYTILNTDCIVATTASALAPRKMFLPNPATAGSDWIITIRDESYNLSSAVPPRRITIRRFGTEKINNTAADKDIVTDGGCVQLYTNGTDWFTLINNP